MYNRLKSARPTYSSNKLENDFRKSAYLDQLHRGKQVNPCMFFETPEKFQRKLFYEMKQESINKDKDNLRNSFSANNSNKQKFESTQNDKFAATENKFYNTGNSMNSLKLSSYRPKSGYY